MLLVLACFWIFGCGAVNNAIPLGLSFEDAPNGEQPASPNPTTTTLPTGNTTSKLNLTWNDNSTNEAGFVIERSDDNGSYQAIATLPRDTITYLDSTVLKGHTYCYRISAYNDSGSSSYSNSACSTAP